MGKALHVLDLPVTHLLYRSRWARRTLSDIFTEDQGQNRIIFH